MICWQISKLVSSDCHFWGVDSSSKAIRTAQAENLFDERFEFLVKDVSQGLPFDDGKFEVIFSKNVLECIPDKLTNRLFPLKKGRQLSFL